MQGDHHTKWSKLHAWVRTWQYCWQRASTSAAPSRSTQTVLNQTTQPIFAPRQSSPFPPFDQKQAMSHFSSPENASRRAGQLPQSPCITASVHPKEPGIPGQAHHHTDYLNRQCAPHAGAFVPQHDAPFHRIPQAALHSPGHSSSCSHKQTTGHKSDIRMNRVQISISFMARQDCRMHRIGFC